MSRIKCLFSALLALLLTLMFTASSLAAANQQEITFRGIDWYTTKADAETKLYAEGASSHGWLGNPNDIYRLSGTDYANVTTGKDRVDGGGYRGWYSNVSVAGYDVDDTYACYIYPIQNGSIIHDDEQAELYFAYYTFKSEYSDHEGIYNDLSEKLTSIYGKGKTQKSRYNTNITWTDKKKNMIRLLINKNKDYVTLGYIAGDATKRLDAMKAALQREAKEEEKQKRNDNKNNKNGL